MLPFSCGLTPANLSSLESLWQDGFVRITGLLSAENIAKLQRECARLIFEQPALPWAERGRYGRQYRLPVFCDNDWSVLSNILGLSTDVDNVLEELFTHQDLSVLLRSVLGSDYKLWELSIRRSESTDGGLRMHQDARGEFGMSVLLKDIPENGGTTVFMPGSHRYPLSSIEAGMPYINPKYLRRWVKPAAGRAGDVFLFCKSVWHGRLPATDAVPHDAILLSFFAAGYSFTPFDVPAEVLAGMPTELRRLLDPSQGMAQMPNGSRLVLGGEGQPPRLIDELYKISPWTAHPSQVARAIRPVAKFAHRLRASFRSTRGKSGRS